MPNDITPRGENASAISTDLASRLLAGIAQSRATTVTGNTGGLPMLRMLKSGDWVIGQTNDEVQEGSRWIVDIENMLHGWCCWTDNTDPRTKNKMVGETMVNVVEPRPPRPPDDNGVPYKDQRTLFLRCIDGDDAGLEVIHKVNSMSGVEAIGKLLGAIQSHLYDERVYVYPVIQFGHSHYEHPKWGRIYTPIYEIVDWCSRDSVLATEKPSIKLVEPEPEPVPPAPAPTSQRKPKLTVPPPAAPVATAQLHTGQRRRPVAR
jgi:hypothetical protein